MKPNWSTTISDCDADPVAPPLSVTRAVSVSMPDAPGVHVALVVPDPPDSVTAPVSVAPPTVNDAVCVSCTPGSVKEAASETWLPTKTTAPGAGAVIFTVGATFAIGTASVAMRRAAVLVGHARARGHARVVDGGTGRGWPCAGRERAAAAVELDREAGRGVGCRRDRSRAPSG